MKKTILSIAVIAAAVFTASCQKENLQGNTASEGNASVFTATIENGADTKTTVERIDGNPAIYKTYWESTDQISIDGSIYTATPDDTDKTKATFNKTSGADPTAPFHAYFPADMYSDSKATLPKTYAYTDGKYNMPMYAESSTMDLSFRNLCGVLAITVKGEDFTSVSSIEVSSDKQMNGEFTATADGTLTFKTEGVTLTDDNKKVALEFTSAKTIASNGSATFYIPVPANTHNPLTIKVTGGSTTKTMVTKKPGGVAVARNTVYPIAFDSFGEADVKADAGISGNKVKWVQLWENGPKFAEINVGVTDGNAESYGGYYTWGGTYNNDSNLSGFSWNDDHNTGSSGLSHTGDDITDTATKLWGNNWRMPTKAELEALLSNCNVAWTTVNGKNGRKFTGKGAYASNSVFLPAAGYSDGTVKGQGIGGFYWSSAPNESGNAFCLQFLSGSQKVYDKNSRGLGCSVRAVLAE